MRNLADLLKNLTTTLQYQVGSLYSQHQSFNFKDVFRFYLTGKTKKLDLINQSINFFLQHEMNDEVSKESFKNS